MSGVNPLPIAKGGKAANPGTVRPPAKKLAKGQDVFDRDIAYTLSTDQFVRQLNIASFQLVQAKDKVEALLEAGEELPKLQKLNQEIESRRESIATGKEIFAACQKLLKQYEDSKFSSKQKVQEHRKLIQERVGSILPEVKGLLANIEHRILLETNRLHIENVSLTRENRTSWMGNWQPAPVIDTSASDRLQEIIRNLEAEKTTLQNAIESQKTQLEGQVKAEKSRADHLEGKRNEALEKLASFQEISRQEKDDNDKDKAMRETRSELESVNTALATAKSQAAESENLRAKVDETTSQIEAQQTRIEGMERTIAEARPVKLRDLREAKDHFLLQQELETAKRKIQTARAEYAALQVNFDNVSIGLQSSQKEVGELASKLSKLGISDAAKTQTIEELGDEKVELLGQLETAISSKESAERQRDEHLRTMTMLENAKDKAISECEKLRKTKDNWVATFKDDKDNWNLERGKPEEEIETLTTEKDKLAKEKQELGKIVGELRQDKVDLRSSRDNLNIEVKAFD
ncbi:hypothetical protein VTL71DRAFT_7743 [Oculimacula yallundae]|uniref:Uncharacterized protein n=1 Tax=Oculimacula yallundae TaxID=86028 RepID=A0ABR4CVQ7_9HELO